MAETRVRVCVPNSDIPVEDNQERAIFSGRVTDSAVEAGREDCFDVNRRPCEMNYSDITALASDIEEVGYVTCVRGGERCMRAATEVAIVIECQLRSGLSNR